MKFISIIALSLLSAQAFAEDFYYRIKVNEPSDNIYMVRSNLSFTDLQSQCSEGKFIVFPMMYAWDDHAKAWQTWHQWDPLYTGEMAIRGSNITAIYKLSGEPPMSKPETGKDGAKDKPPKEEF